MAFYHELAKRPMDKEVLVAFKALQVIHKLLQEGPPRVLQDSTYQLPFLNSLRGVWGRGAERQYAPLITEYAGVLVDKINFHQAHPEFDGAFNIDDFVKKTNNSVPPAEKSAQIVSHLGDLQDALLRFQKLIFTIKTARDLNECRVSALVPMVIESYAIYTMTVYFLKRLVDMIDAAAIFGALVDRFYQQYAELRSFYFESANVKYVASIIAVPTLPKDPPQFLPSKRKNPKELGDADNAPQSTAPAPQINPYRPVDLDAEFEAIHNRSGWDKFGANPEPIAPVAPQPTALPAHDIDRENEWKRRIAELEELLAKERAEKELLLRELAALRAENEQLKEKMRQILETVERERRLAGESQIDRELADLESYLRRFDNPQHLGDQSATAADILAAQRELEAASADLERAARSGNQADLMNSISRLGRALARLLDVVKGASRLTDDPLIKQALFDACRAAGAAISALLNAVRNADSQGFANALRMFSASMGDLGSAANKLMNVDSTETMSESEMHGIEDFAERELLACAQAIAEAARSIERAKAMARKDLSADEMAIATAITDAALAITGATGNLIKMATISQRERVEKGRASNLATFYKKERTFAEGLISAAKAVAGATVSLVEVANLACEGKIEEEKLIAASRQVGTATAQLVASSRVTADPYSPNQKNLEAASKAVQDATRMLVDAAKRPRGRGDGDLEGGTVSERIASARRQAESAAASGNATRMARQKMEQQALIMKIKKELDEANAIYYKLNQQEYNKK